MRRSILKKSLALLVILIVLIGAIFLFKIMSEKVEYEVLSKEELPQLIQEEMKKSSEIKKFHIFNDEKFTYVIYKADHSENEYLTTDLTVIEKNGTYIITAIINWANNDEFVSKEKIIRFEKIQEDDLVFKEIENRKK